MQQKINIGIVIRAMSIGGAEKQSILLAKYLKAKYNVFYFVQKEKPCEEQFLSILIDTGIKPVQLTGSFFNRVKQLNSHIKNNQIQVVFSYLSLDNLLISACKLLNKKFLSVGGVRNSILPYHKFVITRFLHKTFLDYIIFNNYNGRDYFLKKGFRDSGCITIPNCFEINDNGFLDKRPSEDLFTIITVGRFVPQKDYITALRAVKSLQAEEPGMRFRYIIIGYGKLEDEIKNYIRENDIRNVEIVKKPNNISQYYQAADVYLCSSLFEGISNTLLEALSFSLPIVATDAGDNAKIVNHKVNGFIVGPKDHETMAKHILFLAKHKDIREKFGKEGHLLLSRNYSPESFINNYSKFIQGIL